MKHAIALRSFSHAGEDYAAGPVRISAGHFNDWEPVGLVREPTEAELAKLQGDKSKPRSVPKRARRTKVAASPVPAPATTTVVVDRDPDPAAPAA